MRCEGPRAGACGFSRGTDAAAHRPVQDFFDNAYESLMYRRQSIERSARKRTTGRPTEAERREVDEIDAALARIAKGSYGHCERCGTAIGRQRLKALPEARLCRVCHDAAGQE
jgi:hypothetical protein